MSHVSVFDYYHELDRYLFWMDWIKIPSVICMVWLLCANQNLTLFGTKQMDEEEDKLSLDLEDNSSLYNGLTDIEQNPSKASTKY